MIRPTHQPPRDGSPNSFNAASNPPRNILALDQARNADVSLLGSQLAETGVYGEFTLDHELREVAV
jgi:hypothetical protein